MFFLAESHACLAKVDNRISGSNRPSIMITIIHYLKSKAVCAIPVYRSFLVFFVSSRILKRHLGDHAILLFLRFLLPFSFSRHNLSIGKCLTISNESPLFQITFKISFWANWLRIYNFSDII